VEEFKDLIPFVTDPELRANPALIPSFFPEEGIRFNFEDGTHITPRPSGTENKIRFYVQVKANHVTEATLGNILADGNVEAYRQIMDLQAQVQRSEAREETIETLRAQGVTIEAYHDDWELTRESVESSLSTKPEGFYAATGGRSVGYQPIIITARKDGESNAAVLSVDLRGSIGFLPLVLIQLPLGINLNKQILKKMETPDVSQRVGKLLLESAGKFSPALADYLTSVVASVAAAKFLPGDSRSEVRLDTIVALAAKGVTIEPYQGGWKLGGSSRPALVNRPQGFQAATGSLGYRHVIYSAYRDNDRADVLSLDLGNEALPLILIQTPAGQYINSQISDKMKIPEVDQRITRLLIASKGQASPELVDYLTGVVREVAVSVFLSSSTRSEARLLAETDIAQVKWNKQSRVLENTAARELAGRILTEGYTKIFAPTTVEEQAALPASTAVALVPGNIPLSKGDLLFIPWYTSEVLLVRQGTPLRQVVDGLIRGGYATRVESSSVEVAARSEAREGVLPRVNPSRTWEWVALKILSPFVKRMNIAKAFENDPTRREWLSVDAGDIYFDGSKNLITKGVLNLLLGLARKTKLHESIELMFTGAKINETENRAVLHTALRNIRIDEATGQLVSAGPVIVDGQDVMPEVLKELNNMADFVREIYSGVRKGYTGKPFKNVVSIGIGGSYLGPEMAALALLASRVTGMNFYFVANVDGADAASKVTGQIPGIPEGLNPEETLVIVESKTFTTAETIKNAETVKDWILKHYNGDKQAIDSHFVAVSTATDLVKAFGITPDKKHMFGFWDWVGGRYSMWSAIGLPIMLAIGPENFYQMLAGAHAMDVHFRTAPFAKNIPVLKALLNIWNRIFLGMSSLIIAPYSQLLGRLGAYLEQLFMESNGKSIDRNGKRVTYNTSSEIYGESMTNGQHAYQQQPHQGHLLIPEDFIGIVRASHTVPGHQTELLANLFGQTEALAVGKSTAEALREIKADQVKNPGKYTGWTEKDFLWFAKQKTFEGNKPTNLILIDELTPYTFGEMIAMYEHQVATEGFILNIFSFDQWGVELGKALAKIISPLLRGVKEIATAGLTASTAFAIKRVLERQKPADVSPMASVVRVETPAAQKTDETSRSEVRQEMIMGDLSISMGLISLERNPTLEAALITAEKVTAGILSRLDAAKVFVSGVVIKVAQELFPGHFGMVPTGTMAVEAREKASALLGIRTPTASDVFVLGHGFFSQDHRVAAGLREVYPATTIVAIVNTAGERAFLEELNLRLAKEGLLPVLATGPESPAELRAHLAKVQGTVRATALLYSAESIPSALKQQLPNTVIVTSRMLKGFLNAIDMLVSGLVKDLKAQFAMARSA
jgi:glucose-6-phosphate isomerase